MKNSDIICITNRHLCEGDFKEKLVQIAKAHPSAIILREKDMSEEEYRELASFLLPICREEGTRLFLHNFYRVAMELKSDGLHLPLQVLEEVVSKLGNDQPELLLERLGVSELGASCHSAHDARRAKALGCTYILAGHIYDTDCKKGLPGRGLEFLRKVTQETDLPVYAIGGIEPENIDEIRNSGAAGACIMSSAMTAKNVEELLANF
ncbi:thiamine-phosphate pyrophosphorylase [Lachnospiraceae bacterium NE2001]|nr:thiamine-phosphate pyrophosphorylase [Lachnospiraceae bacterium NE2001]